MAKKIILIHGLGGAADETWGNFPKFLEQDLEIDYDIISCGYESHMPDFFKPKTYLRFFKRSPSILNIANGVLTDIQARCNIENDEIIIAGHSLGGIILKKILLMLKNKNISHKIVKVCFFDVPHDGSGYANAGKQIVRRNRHLKSITRDSSELDDLNEQWVNSGLNNVLDILSVISANDDIVSSSSSKSIFREHDVKTINFVDHVTIVKPESIKSTVYIVFKDFILKKNTVVRYKNSASRDIEDWKSVERNHSYNYVFDEKRSNDLLALTSALKLERAVVRLTGASGLGKTRLLLEALELSTFIDDANVLVFNIPGYDLSIKESVRRMVEDSVHGVVVVENYDTELHNFLAKEVSKTECYLKVITIGYSDEQVEDSIQIQLSPLSDDAIKQVLTPILVGMNPNDVDRVARFAQGYPLMATLIAEQYQKEGRLLGSIESDSVIKKLVDGNGGITNSERDVLSACSLFDVFGTAEGSAGEEARFIAEKVAGSDLKTFDRVLHIFTRRQIINRAGRYARLVPKPLALTLASQWWQEASFERQQQLINTIPNSLMQSFCTQASYLDDQPSVQRFSDRLFGPSSPFAQAEVLLTDRGSKLFRAFVEVNPESTSNALYHILDVYSNEQLKGIENETRRNLVWGLEKLCFHAHVFEKSAWCLLLLASAENERWSNNATGMFAQLFRVSLSGTQVKPKIRFDLLRRGIGINQSKIDMVVLEALNQAISTSGGTRTLGAEYQGTKAPLEEWRPKTWQEVWDFWQQSIDLMLMLFERGGLQKEKVLLDIGNSIRGFVARGRIEMLDSVIRYVVAVNGRYWPAALNSIKCTIQYDSEGMEEEIIQVLRNWLDLLNPEQADLSEKLKILITNPPRELIKDEGGHYLDIAAENAKALALEISNNIDVLFPYVESLLSEEQQQSHVFGYQLAYTSAEPESLIDLALECLRDIEQPDYKFVQGLYRGLFDKTSRMWQQYIDKLLHDEKLIKFYPELIRTGTIEKKHLDMLLNLISQGLLPPDSVNVLSYGSATEGVQPDVIADFCINLAKQNLQASWPALNVIYMYCFSNQKRVDILRESLKKLVVSVPLQKGQEGGLSDAYHWYDLAGQILKVHDEDFAVALTNQLIVASKYGFDHGVIWNYTKPLMLDLMKNYGDTLWPILGNAIVQAEGIERYWLKELLDRETSLVSNMPSVLSVLPVEKVIGWCKDFPEVGPFFVASSLNILESFEEKQQPSALFIALLENFGGEDIIANQLRANMASRGWSGSLVPYLESDKAALSPLLEHENFNVRYWVNEQVSYIEREINEETKRDQENSFGYW